MGDRVSIQFEKGNEKSVVLFNHWGGMDFVKEAKKYVKELKIKNAKRNDMISYPLDRLEPQTVMVDFVRHITKELDEVGNNLYFGFDENDGDNNDNGHHIINLNDYVPNKKGGGAKNGDNKQNRENRHLWANIKNAQSAGNDHHWSVA